MTVCLRTRSVDETRAVGAALAGVLRAGDLVLLCGDLGAGKTALTQGIGAGLGVTDRITSPTFVLAQHHRGTALTLHHLDVYRLDHLAETLDLDLPELLDGPAVTCIEWGDAILPALPADYLRIRIRLGGDDDERILDIDGVGPSWVGRLETVAGVCGRWVEPTPPGGPR